MRHYAIALAPFPQVLCIVFYYVYLMALRNCNRFRVAVNSLRIRTMLREEIYEYAVSRPQFEETLSGNDSLDSFAELSFWLRLKCMNDCCQ